MFGANIYMIDDPEICGRIIIKIMVLSCLKFLNLKDTNLEGIKYANSVFGIDISRKIHTIRTLRQNAKC